MEKLRCCVIDDEPLAAELIAGYVRRTEFMELAGVFTSAQQAIKTVLQERVDLVFLDIQMPQLNGVEFANLLPSDCKVVFTTAFDSYAVDGFRVNALDYLLKPVSYEEFMRAANRALHAGYSRRAVVPERDHIIVKSDYKLVQIALDDILYVEGVKDYVKIYTDGNTRSVLTLMNIKSLEAELPASKFMRVHRSFIVNLSKIKVIERNRIVFGNTYIPVSDSYKQAFSDYVASRLIGAVRQSDQEPVRQ